MKTLLAWLCLYVSAFAADPSTGPLFSIWHIDGHGYQWQLDQQSAGLPLETCIRMAQPPQMNGTTSVETNAPLLSQLDRRSVVLRMNNITAELDRTISRVSPLTENNWRSSHLCVRIDATGVMDDTPIPSPFVESSAAWAECGRRWATSPWMVRLQEVIPDPQGVILRENNEGPRLSYSALFLQAGVRKRNSKGNLVIASPSDQPASYVYADDVAPWTYFTRADGRLWSWRWKTDSELDAIDLRAKEWVGPRRNSSPLDPQHAADFQAAENRLYRALYAAFDENLSAGWRGKLRTVGYGHFDENHQNDAASTTLYLGYYRSKVLTHRRDYYESIIAYRDECVANASSNPTSWGELSIAINAQPVHEGAVQGLTAAVDPDSYAGYMTWVAWVMQLAGRDVRLTGWESYRTPPSQRILTDDAAPVLESIGRPELLGVTVGDYEGALLRQLARIHDHPLLRRYWREGTTTVVESPDNDPSTVRVFATETSIPGSPRTLMYVYTPCTDGQLPQVRVGKHVVTHARSAYYLTSPLEPLPPPAVEPLTLEQRVERLERAVFGDTP